MLSNVHEIDEVTVADLSGRVDAATSPEAKAQLHELIAEGHVKIVLNLRELTFLDSSGLGMLVSCLRRCVASGGDVCVAEAPEFVRSIFELTRLTRVFRICDSSQEAAQSMSSDAGRQV